MIKLQATGEEGGIFTVHAELLCFFSPYYRAALKGGFMESGKTQLKVNVQGNILGSVVTWMYSGTVLNMDESMEVTCKILIELYMFADEYDFLALRRCILSTWDAAWPKVLPLYAHVNEAYQHLPTDSPMLRFLVELYTHHWETNFDHCKEEEESRAQAPRQFLSALLAGKSDLMKKIRDEEPVVCDCCHTACNFHEHESWAEREASE